jgi:hypothetical protein
MIFFTMPDTLKPLSTAKEEGGMPAIGKQLKNNIFFKKDILL